MGCRKLTYYNEVEKTASGKLFFSAKSPLKKSGRPFFLNVEGNHLGNVLMVLSDKKLPIFSVSNSTEVDFFIGEILSASDYSAFGCALKEREFSSSKYRYGFNSMEKDDEVKGEGNSYFTEFRINDTRLGRWLSLDRVKFAFDSPYSSMFNSPINYTDKTGLSPEKKKKNKCKTCEEENENSSDKSKTVNKPRPLIDSSTDLDRTSPQSKNKDKENKKEKEKKSSRPKPILTAGNNSPININYNTQEGSSLFDLLAVEVEEFYTGFDNIILNNDINMPTTKDLANNYSAPYNGARYLKYDPALDMNRCLAFFSVSVYNENFKGGPFIDGGMGSGEGFNIFMAFDLSGIISMEEKKTVRGLDLSGTITLGSFMIVVERPMEECLPEI